MLTLQEKRLIAWHRNLDSLHKTLIRQWLLTRNTHALMVIYQAFTYDLDHFNVAPPEGIQ